MNLIYIKLNLQFKRQNLINIKLNLKYESLNPKYKNHNESSPKHTQHQHSHRPNNNNNQISQSTPNRKKPHTPETAPTPRTVWEPQRPAIAPGGGNSSPPEPKSQRNASAGTGARTVPRREASPAPSTCPPSARSPSWWPEAEDQGADHGRWTTVRSALGVELRRDRKGRPRIWAFEVRFGDDGCA